MAGDLIPGMRFIILGRQKEACDTEHRACAEHLHGKFSRHVSFGARSNRTYCKSMHGVVHLQGANTTLYVCKDRTFNAQHELPDLQGICVRKPNGKAPGALTL